MNTQTKPSPISLPINGQPFILRFYIKSTNVFSSKPSDMEYNIRHAISLAALDFHVANTNTPGQFMYTVWCRGLLDATRLGNILLEKGYPLL